MREINIKNGCCDRCGNYPAERDAWMRITGCTHYITINISNEHRSIVRPMYLCKKCSLDFIDWFREVDNGH